MGKRAEAAGNAPVAGVVVKLAVMGGRAEERAKGRKRVSFMERTRCVMDFPRARDCCRAIDGPIGPGEGVYGSCGFECGPEKGANIETSGSSKKPVTAILAKASILRKGSAAQNQESGQRT